MNPPDIEAEHTDLPVDVNPPTTEEIRMAIRQIMSGKAAEPDNIPARALKSDIKVVTKLLHLLFKKIWEKEQLPMKDAVDTQLRDQQAGFRKDRSCTDQTATLRIIVD
ncbi:unnamed protein product [Schistosoma curassoni]|uniref:Reverse transcriptase domain-containing protein n=1 Tax=Schistosoma curassoni TaxID=6186 RepID=A0A183KXL2_9TREM|nr:unnamed protein product [Schistosoma curassoni]